MKVVLTLEERNSIKQLHRRCKERRFADKLKAILLLDKGYSCVEVGELLLLDDDTIRAYATQYISAGANSLLTDDYKGRESHLTAKQIEQLNNHLMEFVYPDSKGIVAWILEHFGITYTPTGINALLKRMNFVYKKPVLIPCKSDEKRQEAFIAEYHELNNQLQPDDTIYFMDGVHPQHNTNPSHGWIKKGTTKHIPSNNGRQRVNINGALNLKTKEVFHVEDERINSQTVIALLLVLLKNQPKGALFIISDNAKYYHSKIVKDFLKEHPRIQFKFLPPYSPNLNIVERLWHILKKKVVYNKFYLKFSDFKIAITDFFKNKVWLNKEFENILTDNFQIIKPNFSGFYL